eukprot:10567071-Ditylum_brightwellii.AAC.1
MPFHMATDVFAYTNTSAYNSPLDWTSLFSEKRESLTCSVLLTASQYSALPQYAYTLATLPIVQGRLGVFLPR